MTFPKYQVRAAHDATGVTERLHGAHRLRLTSAFDVLLISLKVVLNGKAQGKLGGDLH